MVEPSPDVVGGYVVARDGFSYLGIGRTEDEAIADAGRRAGAPVSPDDSRISMVLVGTRLAEAVLDHGMPLDDAMRLAGQTMIPGVPLDIPDADLDAVKGKGGS